MKRPVSNLTTNGNVDIDSAMTPMIDVVFLLLVFFVWTASFQIVEQVLPSELSSQVGSDPTETAEPPPEADFDQVIIQVAYDGNRPEFTLNEQPVPGQTQLENRLRIIADVKPDAPIIVHPRPNVPLEHVLAAYDAAKLSGFAKVSFAVNP